MASCLLVVRSGPRRRQRHQQRHHPDRRDLVPPSAGRVQPARAGQLTQVVVDLAGGADLVERGQFGGRPQAAEDLAEQAQPDRVAERGERLGGVRPVPVDQGLGEGAVLPFVTLAGGQPYRARVEDSPVGRGLPDLGELLFQPVQRPEVAVAEAGDPGSCRSSAVSRRSSSATRCSSSMKPTLT